MTARKQNSRLRLVTHQDHSEERRLASSFLGMVGALSARPEPRYIWDDVASPGRREVPGLRAVIAAKAALRAAIATGKLAVVEETASRVQRFFTEAADLALADYYAITSGRISITDARVKASKETSEALHAILTSTAQRNDACPMTVKEIDEAIEALADLRAQMTVAQQPINRRPALALS